MDHLAYLVLRRLRRPLILIIATYSICILGYKLIPGADEMGNPYHMSFFEAFYFVSYMGSTIGFGELPHAFTSAQRFWTSICIYATVVSWIYSIGAVIAVLQDATFSRLIRRSQFRRRVQGMNEPFYLVCGYGLTGNTVVADLAHEGVNSVVIDIKQDRIDALELGNLPFDILGLCADASDPTVLRDAGIEHPQCRGTLCLTDDDHVNLYIALTSKLLQPERVVISRVASREYAGNLASFNTDHVIDPFQTFAEYLASAVVTPYRQLSYNWLIDPKHRTLDSVNAVQQGRWIICGYGRLGKAIQKRFERHGLETVIIEPDPEHAHVKDDYRVVKGLGTEAPTLMEAGIHSSVGIIAGTADDANNLSIIMTARDMREHLMTVARKNHHPNTPIFDAAKIDMVMDPHQIIAQRILVLIKTPLLMEFVNVVGSYDEEWHRSLVEKFDQMVNSQPLDTWVQTIDKDHAPAIYERLRHGKAVTLQHLLSHRLRIGVQLKALALMVRRDKRTIVLPELDFDLKIGDQLLFCGRSDSESKMLWTAYNEHVLESIVHPADMSQSGGWVWRTWFGKRDQQDSDKAG